MSGKSVIGTEFKNIFATRFWLLNVLFRYLDPKPADIAKTSELKSCLQLSGMLDTEEQVCHRSQVLKKIIFLYKEWIKKITMDKYRSHEVSENKYKVLPNIFQIESTRFLEYKELIIELLIKYYPFWPCPRADTPPPPPPIQKWPFFLSKRMRNVLKCVHIQFSDFF